jgi:hypothetical protein
MLRRYATVLVALVPDVIFAVSSGSIAGIATATRDRGATNACTPN